MRMSIRTALSLAVSVLLLSVLTMAQPGGKNADKDKNKNKTKQHHSRLAKVAFWRHHKNADKRGKAPASSRHARAKTAKIRPASAKQAAGKTDQKQHTGNTSKTAANKAPAGNKTQTQQKAEDDPQDSFANAIN